jgi:hypothetical protein
MSLNRGELNPLSVLKMRKLSFIPEHFTKVIVDSPKTDIKLLDQWINYNLNSRYSIKKSFVLDQNKKMVEAIEIGIEDPKESMILSLGCPYLHKN